jgi:hypothetical protein
MTPKPELTAVPLSRTGTRAGAAHRLQFSLVALMLATLVFGITCAAIRWLGSVWFVPLSLAGISAANLVLAVRRGSNWRMLKLGHWHFAIWLALAAAASGLAVCGCLVYNLVAGTDKTPGHIVQISAAVLAGPMVGPVANPGAGEYPQARTWTATLFTALVLAASPFLFVRRIVPLAVALICWTAFLAATILWFFGAMISLGVFLS